MNLRVKLLAGGVVILCPSAFAAQAQTATQKKAPTVQPTTPATTKTTTTNSTTATTPVADETGAVGAQQTTNTTSTTSTQPATPGSPATKTTSSTTTVAPDETGQPAATTTTTTTEPATDKTGAAVTAATDADVKAGVPVFDAKGGVVGKVESVSAKGAVVSTGKARAEIPLSSFGKNDKGLVISMTKAELEASAAAKTPPKKK
jgi:hypothetical protein